MTAPLGIPLSLVTGGGDCRTLVVARVLTLSVAPTGTLSLVAPFPPPRADGVLRRFFVK